MTEYQVARCLFCTTGREARVVRLVEEQGLGVALFPQRIKTVMKNHCYVEEKTPLLPGYVFIYSDSEEPIRDRLLRLPHVVRVLSYRDSDSDVLRGRDREFADWVWRTDGCIERARAIQVGDRVEIVDGLLKELHGKVIRMDRRRKTFLVELEGHGAFRNLWLSYEIVEAVP